MALPSGSLMKCGENMELSPEERQRIYAEEKARLEAQQILKAEKKPGCSKRVLGCFALAIGAVLVFAIIGSLLPDKPKAPASQQAATVGPPSPSEVTVKLSSPLFCSKSILDIGTLARVRAAGDIAGAIGLVARDKALLLEAGTTVHVVNHNSERASLYVRSGGLVGEDCWIQPGWITASTR